MLEKERSAENPGVYYTPEEVQRVIDPACGAGAFLQNPPFKSHERSAGATDIIREDQETQGPPVRSLTEILRELATCLDKEIPNVYSPSVTVSMHKLDGMKVRDLLEEWGVKSASFKSRSQTHWVEFEVSKRIEVHLFFRDEGD